jgi:radical SAM protein with 4Fe4S-binding SPASM domain
MSEYQDIYISLPEDSTLNIYRSQGVLCLKGEKVKINKKIVDVIHFCLKGYPLYDAIQQCSTHSSDNFIDYSIEVSSGILELLAENKLISLNRNDKKRNFSINNEDNVFYPQSLHVELTEKCNQDCYYCYNNSGANLKKTEISEEMLFPAISELSEKGLEVVELTGGEPLLHPNFFNILEFCCKNIKLVSVLTNGTLVDKNFVSRLKKIQNKPVFSISLDSYSELEHERKSRVKGSFKKTTDAIRLLSKENFIVRVSMAVDESNWQHIEKTLLLAQTLGTSKFTYSPIIPVGRAKSESMIHRIRLQSEEIMNYEQYLMDNYSDFLHVLDKKSQEKLHNSGGCGAGSRTFVMNSHGDIRMCATFGNGIIGNVSEKPLKTLFSNPLCLLSSQITPPSFGLCHNCRYLSFCSGCFMRATLAISEIDSDKCGWISNEKTNKEWFSKATHNSI